VSLGTPSYNPVDNREANNLFFYQWPFWSSVRAHNSLLVLAPATPIALTAAAASTRANVRVLSSPRRLTEAVDLVMHSPTTTRLSRYSAKQRPSLPLPQPPSPPKHRPPPAALARLLERNLSLVLAPATPIALTAAAASTRVSVRVLSSPRRLTEAVDLVMHSPTTTRLRPCAARRREGCAIGLNEEICINESCGVRWMPPRRACGVCITW
jgi:hypothetical protein